MLLQQSGSIVAHVTSHIETCPATNQLLTSLKQDNYVLINYVINILYIIFFSFPGGKKDPEDSSLIETAIREMDEELGLDRRHVEVWAPMPTMPDRVRHCLSK